MKQKGSMLLFLSVFCQKGFLMMIRFELLKLYLLLYEYISSNASQKHLQIWFLLQGLIDHTTFLGLDQVKLGQRHSLIPPSHLVSLPIPFHFISPKISLIT